MTNYRSVEFFPYGLTAGYYQDETVFDVTEDSGTSVPMRTAEFNTRYAADNRTPTPGGDR